MNRFVRQEEGSAAVLIVMCMTVLIGFIGLVIDSGMMFYDRTQLQKAVDAAALAGAYDLPQSPGSAASDASTYLQSNGVTGGVNQTTVTYNGNPSSGSGPYPANQLWKVTAQRTVPTGFGAMVGFGHGTVTASATAVNSPLSSTNDLVPYALWGGNTWNCPSLTPGTSGLCQDSYVQSHVPPGGVVDQPCCGFYTPPPPPLGPGGATTWGDWCSEDATNRDCVPDIPSSSANYNYMTFWELTGPTSGPKRCPAGGSWCIPVIYRDNQWPSTVVYPDPQNCGNNNQPPCNPNWNVGGNVKFKGFFNNLQGGISVGWDSNAWTSNGGDGAGKEPWDQLCGILARPNPQKRVAVMPVVDSAQYNSSSGSISFHVAYLMGVYLDNLSGCSGGSQMGTSFDGWTFPGWNTSRGVGSSSQSPGAAHVLQLWQ